MKNYIKFFAAIFAFAVLLAGCAKFNTTAQTVVSADAVKTPPNEKTADKDAAPIADTKNQQTAVLAGGCFWGLEAVYEHVKGVSDVTSGYTGGKAETADYETVSTGTTGHAESVKITYDPKIVSYEQLLNIFFSVVHDPTELNRQGPDTGSQYRSAIFFTDAEQQKAAQNYIAKLTAEHIFDKPIVTQVTPLEKFYPAEDYHQNYLEQHPNQPYIVINDQPKVDNLSKQFPDLYVGK